MRAATSPEEAVTQFIQDRGDLWHLTPEDIATVKVVSTSPRGLPTVNLIQQVEGKEVFNSDVTASLGRKQRGCFHRWTIFPKGCRGVFEKKSYGGNENR